MVGGIIIETRTINSRKMWVNVEERPINGSHKPGVCAIYINPVGGPVGSSVSWKPKRGDAIWWQGNYAMWTPKDDDGETLDPNLVDIKLLRIGFSGVSAPEHRA